MSRKSLHLNPAIQSLLPRAVQLNICSSACPLYVAPLPNTDSIVYDPFHAGDPVPEQMLACTGPDPIPGVYVATNLHSVLHPPVALPMSETRPSAGLYTFVPTGCTFQHDGLRFRNHGSCLEMKERVLFIGDSHARAAYDALLHRLGGNDTVVQVSEKIQTKSGDLNNLHMVRIKPLTSVVVDTETRPTGFHLVRSSPDVREARRQLLTSLAVPPGTRSPQTKSIATSCEMLPPLFSPRARIRQHGTAKRRRPPRSRPNSRRSSRRGPRSAPSAFHQALQRRNLYTSTRPLLRTRSGITDSTAGRTRASSTGTRSPIDLHVAAGGASSIPSHTRRRLRLTR